MTIHPVRMNGMMLGVPQTMNYFEKMQDRITTFVTSNSKMKPERFKELMMERDELVLDIGTVLDGKTAVKEGLIDRLGSLSAAVNRLYKLIEKQRSDENKKAKPSRKASEDTTVKAVPVKAKRGRPKKSSENREKRREM